VRGSSENARGDAEWGDTMIERTLNIPRKLAASAKGNAAEKKKGLLLLWANRSRVGKACNGRHRTLGRNCSIASPKETTARLRGGMEVWGEEHATETGCTGK